MKRDLASVYPGQSIAPIEKKRKIFHQYNTVDIERSLVPDLPNLLSPRLHRTHEQKEVHVKLFNQCQSLVCLEADKRVEKLGKWSPDQLENEGYRLCRLRAKREGKLLSDHVVCLYTRNKSLPFNRFSQGDAILIQRKNNLTNGGHSLLSNNWSGTIIDKTHQSITLLSSTVPLDVGKGEWQIEHMKMMQYL